LSLPGQRTLDLVLAASLVLNSVFAVLHLVAGRVLFVRGTPVKFFDDDPWTPHTKKQRVLLGGYLALSWAWLQVAALMLGMLAWGNPLGVGLGIVGLVSFAGQMWAMRGNDAVALAGLSLHFAVLVLWTAGTWMHGG
jgi:hypothetical protein